MAFNINQFKADGLKLGGARPSLFQVDIFSPLDLGSLIAGGGATVSPTASRTRMFVQASSLPASIMGRVDVPYMGRKIPFAGDRDFADWTVTVQNDEDFAIRAMFENWSNKINAHISNRMSGDVYPTGYKSVAEVTQFGKDGALLRSYRMEGVFPTQISDIPLDWGMQNEIERFQVTFAFDAWVPVIQGTNDAYTGIISPDPISGIVQGPAS